ncbi:MAG: hypothetical protein HC769_02065 [Cyanobacteria bacterium CRU_2_1]|nr:hypothetical protein [Cyanobacteria bacterium RU_5_0]NJR57741.1 hypothetical protein [Cyanobacteria bacterium CRU_2_1]
MMKPELQRIEATLDQLNLLNGHSLNDRSAEIVEQSGFSTPSGTPAPTKDNQKSQFQVQEKSAALVQPFPFPPKGTEAIINHTVASSSSHTEELSSGSTPTQPRSTPIASMPFSTEESCLDLPMLPRSQSPNFNNPRHAANPSLPLTLLKDIEATVVRWQQELEAIVRQIRALYAEGPIVDGWLESHSAGSQPAVQTPGIATLRHAEVEHLMEYVEQICSADPPPIMDDIPRTDYRLCGLDADGQIWSRSCPPEQVPYVSLAIARYQKLRTLLGKKQAIENRLTHLVETLTGLHGQIKD